MLTQAMDRLIVRTPLRVFRIYRLFIWRSAISDLRYRYAGSAMGVFWNVLIPQERSREPGAGSEISIKDLTESIARLTGFEGEIRWNTAYPDGQPRRALDASRAAREFGFQARVTLEEGLKRAIEWYQDHLSGTE